MPLNIIYLNQIWQTVVCKMIWLQLASEVYILLVLLQR